MKFARATALPVAIVAAVDSVEQAIQTLAIFFAPAGCVSGRARWRRVTGNSRAERGWDGHTRGVSDASLIRGDLRVTALGNVVEANPAFFVRLLRFGLRQARHHLHAEIRANTALDCERTHAIIVTSWAQTADSALVELRRAAHAHARSRCSWTDLVGSVATRATASAASAASTDFASANASGASITACTAHFIVAARFANAARGHISGLSDVTTYGDRACIRQEHADHAATTAAWRATAGAVRASTRGARVASAAAEQREKRNPDPPNPPSPSQRH